MTIEQTVEIPSSHRLTIDVPREIPAGRAILAFTPALNRLAIRDEWVNPLLGLAKTKGAKLTLERFIEMQQEEIDRENGTYHRLSLADAVGVSTAIDHDGVFVTSDHHELEAVEKKESLKFFWFR